MSRMLLKPIHTQMCAGTSAGGGSTGNGDGAEGGEGGGCGVTFTGGCAGSSFATVVNTPVLQPLMTSSSLSALTLQ